MPGRTLAESLPYLQATYCGTMAYEIEHISTHEERVWLREKIESGAYRKPPTADQQRWLLRRLTEVEALERFLHKAYLGQKRFSIEGVDMLVPMLDHTIESAAESGAPGCGDRHGASWPAQRAGPYGGATLRDHLCRVRRRTPGRGGPAHA